MSEPGGAAGPLVLIVDDEPQVRRFLRISLAAHGYRVLEAASGGECLKLAPLHVPDLVLLDLGLPDLDGLELTRRLREWSRVPIVVLSARGGEDHKVQALDAGADDYLTKPFGLGELLARLRVALRHQAAASAVSSAGVFESGPLRVDLAGRRVQVEGREIHLSPVEYKLLAVLVQHAGKVVTQRQLMEEVWGPKRTEQTHYLRVYMTHLRRKLEPDPLRPRLFQTEAGVGYRLQYPADS